jgi:hypothetical protein
MVGRKSIKISMSPIEKISFEEAARVIYFMFCREPKIYMKMMEELLDHSEESFKVVAPIWYDQYRNYLKENKQTK